jgi:hypothetical protein
MGSALSNHTSSIYEDIAGVLLNGFNTVGSIMLINSLFILRNHLKNNYPISNILTLGAIVFYTYYGLYVSAHSVVIYSLYINQHILNNAPKLLYGFKTS